MPNIVGHIAIASEVFDWADEQVLVGSTLPDFVGIHNDFNDGSIRLREMELEDGVAIGVNLHVLTDKVFDSLDATRGLIRAAKADLEKLEELPRGAAWAVAEAGTELLLDGVIVEVSGSADKFRDLARYVLNGRLQLGEDNLASPLDGLIKDYFKRGVPTRYQDPEFVAVLLQNRLETRGHRLTTFSQERIPEVAAALDKQLSRLQQSGALILGQTTETVSSHLRSRL